MNAAQLPLPTAPFVARQTSVEAAKRIVPHIGRLEERVLIVLKHGPMTDEQLDGYRYAAKTLRPRRIRLTQIGLIEDSGETALTTSGRRAILWQLSDKGRGYMEGD